MLDFINTRIESIGALIFGIAAFAAVMRQVLKNHGQDKVITKYGGIKGRQAKFYTFFMFVAGLIILAVLIRYVQLMILLPDQ